MNLYVWNSLYLKAYASGTIVVIAPSVEEARRKARINFEADIRERHEWLFLDPNDPDEQEMIEEHRAKFENDIASEPETTEVLFIGGSD